MTSAHPIPGTRGERSWTAAEQEAYLDSRPVGGPYNPAADYGDSDWREPESDDEAAARTAHLAAQPRDPETTAWVERIAAISEEEKALIDASVELEHARATHDPDEIAAAHATHQAALAAADAREHGDVDPGEPLPDWLDGELTEPDKPQPATEHDQSEQREPELELDEEEAEL